MRKLFSGAAVLAFAVASASGTPASAMSSMAMGMHAMPKCSHTNGPVVWYVPSTKTYYPKGSATSAMGSGMYVCRATARMHGAKMGAPGAMMQGGMRHGGSMGTMHGGAMGTGGSMGTMHGGATPANPPPVNGMGNGNAAPGSQSTPMPLGTMRPNPNAGNQGNTGAPGAGGMVPNNAGSTSNSVPSPRPT